MQTFWGIAIAAIALLCWGGQTIAWVAPRRGVRWHLIESPDDVEPMYWADIRGEGLWDACTLWTMVAAGMLLTVDNPAWPYFGLVGGGMYVYFAGRGIATRRYMVRGGFRVGLPADLKVAMTALAMWGVMGLAVIVAAANTLAGS